MFVSEVFVEFRSIDDRWNESRHHLFGAANPDLTCAKLTSPGGRLVGLTAGGQACKPVITGIGAYP
jgi:hypothetical protein